MLIVQFDDGAQIVVSETQQYWAFTAFKNAKTKSFKPEGGTMAINKLRNDWKQEVVVEVV